MNKIDGNRLERNLQAIFLIFFHLKLPRKVLLLLLYMNGCMKRYWKIVGLLAFLGLFTACTTLKPITFERLQAADVSYPDAVRSVGVINALPPMNLDENEVDYAAAWLEGDGKVAANALAQEIASTRYFDQVVVCDSSLRSGQSAPAAEAFLLPKQVVDSLIHALGVDMLFVFERVYIQMKESTLYIPEVMSSVPALDGVVTPVLRAYIAGRDTPLFAVSESDTLCWEITPELHWKGIVKDASEYAATMPIEHLLPHWAEMNRFYYDGSDAVMRDAGVYVREQNWEAAAQLWQDIYDQKKGKARMRAAFNLALYHELQDDYEKALAYIDEAARLTSEDSTDGHLIEFYRQQLKQQAAKFIRLNVQMNRFK